MSNQTKNNNLNYLIDPTFTNVNRLFVLSFKNEHGNHDDFFSKNIMYQKLKQKTSMYRLMKNHFLKFL